MSKNKKIIYGDNNAKKINEDDVPSSGDFTFDSITITFDSVEDTFDEK